MIQTDVLQKTKHPKYLDSWYFSSDSLPSCWQSRWVYKAGAEVGTIDYGRLWLYWYHNGAPGFWGWVCWATPCSTYGCVWKYSIPPNSYFDRENDDNPVDLVVHYFQTNPYFGPCFVAKKKLLWEWPAVASSQLQSLRFGWSLLPTGVLRAATSVALRPRHSGQ